MDIGGLKRYLVNLGVSEGQQTLSDQDLQGIQEVLYYAATNDGQYIKHLFPDITDEEISDVKKKKALYSRIRELNSNTHTSVETPTETETGTETEISTVSNTPISNAEVTGSNGSPDSDYLATSYPSSGDLHPLNNLQSIIPSEDDAMEEGVISDYSSDYRSALSLTEDANFSTSRRLGTVSFLKRVKKDSYSHPPDKTCGRTLLRGETTYRCADCGFDDTCILCKYCFNPKDHIDHDVYLNLASDSHGSICDCGDPEAFTKPLHCKCQEIDHSQETINILQGFKSALNNTIRVVLNYILDVANVDPYTLPMVHDHLKLYPSKIRLISDRGCLTTADYGGAIDKNSEMGWHLLLWNDEFHDYPQTEAVIMLALSCEQSKAHRTAASVDKKGSDLVGSSPSLDELLEKQKILELQGLTTTIISNRDYRRNQIVQCCIEWLLLTTQYGDNLFREEARSAMCSILLESDYRFSTSFPINLIMNEESPSFNKSIYENSILHDNRIPEIGKLNIKDEVLDSEIWNKKIEEIWNSDEKINFTNSRVQFLLIFEKRFNKKIRKDLKAFLPLVLTFDIDLRTKFTQQLLEIYPILFTSLALNDREEHQSFLFNITSQVFTCPPSIQAALALSEKYPNGSLGNILSPLIRLLEEKSSFKDKHLNYSTFIQCEESNGKGIRVQRVVDLGIRELKIIFSIANSNVKEDYITDNNIYMILLFLRYFQGYWGIEKKYGEHVEREIMDYVIHSAYSIPILSIAKDVAEFIIKNSDEPEHLIKLIMNFLMKAKINMRNNEIAFHKISQEKTSFINPINSLLSYIIEMAGFETSFKALKSSFIPFVRISDFSLRSIVLASQIRIGFWVRNGISVSRQASMYFSSMCESTFFRDFHLQQINSIMGFPPNVFMNFLNRWELDEWFRGTPHAKTIYEDRFNSIMLEFIIFLFNLITDRSFFNYKSQKEKLYDNIKKSIIYTLVSEPKGYTELKQYTERRFGECDDFDNILKEVANYQAPSGLTDSGIFRLKPKYFNSLNPMSLFLDGSEFITVSQSLTKHFAKKENIKESEVVLIPQFEFANSGQVDRLVSRFTKDRDFVKFVYKLLQVCIDTSDETFMLPLLHLIHAVLLDDQHLHGDDYLTGYFVMIPISDLLLTIIESNMSAQIAKKAEYLLNFLTSRDPSVIESLNDCFGAEHVAKYLKKSNNAESESDKRKRMAEERKQKLMKKFAKQRETFLQNNEELLQTMASDESNDKEARNCVLCGEDESSKALFGILGTFNPYEFWHLPAHSDITHARVAFEDWDNQSLREGKNDYGKGFHGLHEDVVFNQDNPVFVVSTCGHGMHHECYDSYCSQLTINDVPCPLCKVSSNMLVPSPSPGKLTSDEDEWLLNSKPIHTKYNQITSSVGRTKCQTIVNKFIQVAQLDETIKSVIQNFLQFFHRKPFLDNYADKYVLILEVFASLISNTIQMHEITSRIDGNLSYSNFLSQVPNSAKAMIRSLCVYRALFFASRELIPYMKPPNNMEATFAAFWDEFRLNSVSTEVIYLFFQTDESFLTLSRFGYVKEFAIIMCSLMTRSQVVGNDYSTIFKSNGRVIDPETEKHLQYLLGEYASNYHSDDPNFVTSLYFSIEKCLLPLLRTLIIFKDIFTSNLRKDNTYESIPELQTLEDEILSQDYEGCSDVLAKKLGLPTLKTLIANLASDVRPPEYDFESSIFLNVVNAKIPKFFSKGILTLSYPGVCKFIELPEDYNACISSSLTTLHDFSICLLCGTIVRLGNYNESLHIPTCSRKHTTVFFHPRTNKLQVFSYLGSVGPIQAAIDAPYLTEFGEVRKSGKATLNSLRFQHLNKLWLNKGLFQLLSRLIFTQETNMPTDRNDIFDTNDDEDDDGPIESVDDIVW